MKLLEHLLSSPALESAEAETSVTVQPKPEPAECGPDCYEVEPGRRIHRPWTDKCRAKIQDAEPRQVERVCWHCRGELRCGCISCAEYMPAGRDGECGICHGTGRTLAWVH
jgi:hypothetical protein